MVDKVDLVMWTKNGAQTLPLVLRRIGQVIPSRYVAKRIIVDDKSEDGTCKIAERFGWQVMGNRGSGISDGANTALEHVAADYFVSFEQDLLLASDWWEKVPPYLLNDKIAAASGIRLPSRPVDLKKTIEYAMERYQKKQTDGEAFFIGKTLDNTIYKTRIVREVGGFPKLSIPAGIDNVLAQRFDQSGFRWRVDYTVKSVHLRNGLRDELKHDYWYGTCFNILVPLLSKKNLNIKPMVLRLLFSPIRGLDIAFKKKAPTAVVIYPLTRLAMLRGVVAGRKT
jgi:glycosyltransferase involved in cell wall biosynthesis